MKKLLLILLSSLCGWSVVSSFSSFPERKDEWSMIKGNASYYADKFHGRRTASGEIYHKDSMTCAHLKFPFGTMLKVRNPINDRTVIVRVTDRGPYSKRFIIDLSRAAARKLDIITAGFSMVEITPYHPNTVPFRAEDDSIQIPELDLLYTPAAIFPEPVWQRDSTRVLDKLKEETSTWTFPTP